MIRCTLLYFLVGSTALFAQPDLSSLKSTWLVSTEAGYQPYRNQPVQAIHFGVDAAMQGSYLVVVNRHPYSVFVNGTLQWQAQDTLRIDADSLLRVYKGNAWLSVYQPQLHSLQTFRQAKIQLQEDASNPLRPPTYFHNFTIVAVLLVFIFLVSLYRASPSLMFDYLNVIKLFSAQERDDASSTGRIGASINLIFFAVISFLVGLLVLILFKYSGDRFYLATLIEPATTAGAFAAWLTLAAGVFVILLLRLVLIFLCSSLFGLRDTVRFHFFHFVRFLFIVSLLTGVTLVVYFMMGVATPSGYATLFLMACISSLAGSAFLFIKLLGRTSLPVFHLFSYLCASEIIPLIILGKVLLF
ncbi:MAG: DUF4271 domain-containing protein [Cyclobacteriaceae bacterium]|nr:DUF4271 domain-containing protein [Cyclobacteriaceae bacterium]